MTTKKSQLSTAAILGSTLVVGALSASNTTAGVPKTPTHWEKCAGIVKQEVMIAAHLMVVTAARAKPKLTT